MKRWIFWSFASILSFVIGWTIVFTVSNLFVPSLQDRTYPLVGIEPGTPQQKEFVAEFRDLPTFEDIDQRKPVGRLIEIVSDGIFRRSDVVAVDGEKWLVLVGNGTEFSIRDLTASVKKLRSSSWPGDELDARLTFNTKAKAFMAFQYIPALRPGPVTTLFHQSIWADQSEAETPNNEIADGYYRELRLGSKIYTLRSSKGVTRDGTKVAVLVLESGGLTQVIKQTHHVESDNRDIIGSLIWAGDLDKDGQLDLYFDEFNEKGFTATELHISSQADEGQLVGLAAHFGMPGC